MGCQRDLADIDTRVQNEEHIFTMAGRKNHCYERDGSEADNQQIDDPASEPPTAGCIPAGEEGGEGDGMNATQAPRRR